MAVYELAGKWRRRTLKLENGATIELPPAPRILAYMRSYEHRLSGNIEFLIDTGADYTTIMPDDRANIVVPDYALVHGYPEVMVGVGGGVGRAYKGTPSLLGRDFLNRCRLDISEDRIILHFED